MCCLAWMAWLSPIATAAFEVNPDNTVPGVVANSLFAHGNGSDWQLAQLVMELTEGSVYNAPDFDSVTPQQNLWGTFPDLEFDTWVGIPGDSSGSIQGGAPELGHPNMSMSGQIIAVTWFNTRQTDTGVSRIANVSLTDDAQGTFSVIAGFAPAVIIEQSGWVVDGAAYFDLPGDLDSDGFVGINDLNYLLAFWNQTVPPANAAADPSGDGFVGIEDLNLVLGFWNKGTPPSASADVPEPATLAVMLLLLPACRMRTQRPA